MLQDLALALGLDADTDVQELLVLLNHPNGDNDNIMFPGTASAKAIPVITHTLKGMLQLLTQPLVVWRAGMGPGGG